MPPEVILKLHTTLFCFSMIYCAFFFFSKVTHLNKQRICIHKEVVKHKLVLKKPFLLESFLLIVILLHSFVLLVTSFHFSGHPLCTAK